MHLIISILKAPILFLSKTNSRAHHRISAQGPTKALLHHWCHPRVIVSHGLHRFQTIVVSIDLDPSLVHELLEMAQRSHHRQQFTLHFTHISLPGDQLSYVPSHLSRSDNSTGNIPIPEAAQRKIKRFFMSREFSMRFDVKSALTS